MSDSIPFQAPEPDELSALLGRYKVSSLIAVGGMGAVYHATQTSLDREVAIKLLPKELGGPSFRAQFKAEARAMAKLNHPNLIGIFDFGEADGMPYIVMEYVPGKSLYYSCYEKAIEQEVAIRLTSEICSGLAHAHEHDIIHRDIKPANILLDEEAHAKIGDFGLASESEDGLVYGTPGYAAPEILIDGSQIGKPSDIFAVGVILHQLLTGKMPEDDPRPASRIGNCHPGLDRIIRKATHRDPENRYQDCRDLIADLADLGKTPARTVLATAERAAPARLNQGQSPPPEAAPDLKTPPEDGPATPSQSPPQATLSTGSNWPLLRNLVIIALLIPALLFTWKGYQNKEARQNEIAEAARLEKEKIELAREATRAAAVKAAEAKRAEAESAKKEKEEQARRIAKMQDAKPVLTPLQQLAKARNSLVGGARDTFPDGTLNRSNIRVFFVETPMAWSEASEFCEAHGGHLYTPLQNSDLGWIGEQLDDASLIWLGGGSLGSADWGWVTGEEWKHDKPSTALGTCAAITASGIIKARPNGVKLPFFIQWHNDGSNPGSLDAQLGRLQGTLDSPSPAWPPGTLANEGRNYLLIHRALPWDEADLIASSAGGHLAVPSNSLEKIYLTEALSTSLISSQSAWLGGRLEGGVWTWITGEPWENPQWRKDSPDGGQKDSALRFTCAREDSGWDDADPDDPTLATSFLIEWSKDAQKAPAKVQDESTAELSRLKVMAAKLLRRKIAERNSRFEDNIKDLTWESDGWLRSQTKTVSTTHSPAIDAYRQTVSDTGRIPENLDDSNLPEPIKEMAEEALARQKRFENTLEIDTINLRNAYLGKLLAQKLEFQKANLKAKVARIDDEIQALGQDATSFRNYFEIEK